MSRGSSIALVVALVVSSACAGPTGGPQTQGESAGPPEVRLATVRAHSEQFDQDDPRRPAGSQGEGIAATYLLGHLQRSGYQVYLDPVPVSNLVSSTNVVALPAAGDEPSVVVVVPYDTTPGTPDTSPALGLFLEVARALKVSGKGAAVEFVALGAERAEVSGGRLGSRRLAKFMRDRSQHPVVVSLEDVTLGASGPVEVRGGASEGIDAAARAAGVAARTEVGNTPTVEVFSAAGIRSAALSGPAGSVGAVLLEYLVASRP
jgi:hypothetical protein